MSDGSIICCRFRRPTPFKATQCYRSVASVLDEFIEKYAFGRRPPLRSAREYASTFDRLVNPALGSVNVFRLRRSNVTDMLDRIAVERGAVMADRTLAYLRKALNWYAARDERFSSPIVPGMMRTSPSDLARTRILYKNEIRLIWNELNNLGTFGDLVKILLLTGQRRDEVAGMARPEVSIDGIWTIPANRHKSKRAHQIPLSCAARSILSLRPSHPVFYFASAAGTPFSSFAKQKSRLNFVVGPIEPWTLHDLRRTAKTLMLSAGVRPDITERVLGHRILGIQGVYDQYHYFEEKRDALERLAHAIGGIIELDASIHEAETTASQW
jgi:integrase